MEKTFEERRQWFEGHTSTAGSSVHEPVLPVSRYACPCCGYPTLGERGGHEICELCDWQDDGQDDPHADEVWGGPNREHSLTDARHNFQRHGSMYSSNDGSHPDELGARRWIIEAFDGMVGEAGGPVVRSLWKRVVHGEKALREVRERARGRRAREQEKGG